MIPSGDKIICWECPGFVFLKADNYARHRKKVHKEITASSVDIQKKIAEDRPYINIALRAGITSFITEEEKFTWRNQLAHKFAFWAQLGITDKEEEIVNNFIKSLFNVWFASIEDVSDWNGTIARINPLLKDICSESLDLYVSYLDLLTKCNKDLPWNFLRQTLLHGRTQKLTDNESEFISQFAHCMLRDFHLAWTQLEREQEYSKLLSFLEKAISPNCSRDKQEISDRKARLYDYLNNNSIIPVKTK